MLDYLNNIIDDYPAIIFLTLGLGVFIATVAAPYVFRGSDVSRSRLRAASPLNSNELVRQSVLLRERPDDRLVRFARYLEPNDPRELSDARMRMMRAGYQSRFALRFYTLMRGVLGIGFGVLGGMFGVAVSDAVAMVPVLTLIGGLVGYMIPLYWVTRRIQVRRDAVQDGFPDSLDMLLVCVEAGQSLDQAIARVAEEIEVAHPMLAEEYQLLSLQLRAGRDRIGAMRSFGERVDIQDVRSCMSALIQSSEMGTSISGALRIYAIEMRDKRTNRAEEKANVLPVKLALGTMAFTVPPLLLILLGPAIIKLMEGIGTLGQQ